LGRSAESEAGKYLSVVIKKLAGLKPEGQASVTLRIGTAGWNVPACKSDAFPRTGSHLERYAAVLNCVEIINSSFHRPHQRKTYERWARATPDAFRFAVKLPRSISHADDLQFQREDLTRFVGEIGGLGSKFGVLLVQFPPRLPFEKSLASKLFDALRRTVRQPIACEPRHSSWFRAEVSEWMAKRRVARVAADPERSVGAGEPGGWQGLRYFRLHGSPRIYYSSYERSFLQRLDQRLMAAPACDVWCVFDNTALGGAMENALMLQSGLQR
jgi:uncharacterized protein YecE (DUF72 family)